MDTEQFCQILEAILAGKYSWACVLMLNSAGCDPLDYIPYRTYTRLVKDNCQCGHSSQDSKSYPNQVFRNSSHQERARFIQNGFIKTSKPSYFGERMLSILSLSPVKRKIMNAERIDEILQEFAFKPLGIRGAALISSEGQAVTVPIGMDESSALVVAGTMLHLAKRTNEEFRLQEIENITVRGRDGHVVLKNCNDEVFLLVRAGRALTGLLDVEINRTISKLQDELATNDGN